MTDRWYYGSRVSLAGCLALLLSQVPYRAESLSAAYVGQARLPVGASEPVRVCGTPSDVHRPARLALDTPIADGEPLRADQFPRFIRPTHEGVFGFDMFVVLGDHATLTFERRDLTQETSVSTEIWTRTGTSAVDGRLVSVFGPVWEASVLHDALRMQRWGVDRPYLLWGHVVVPRAESPVGADGGLVDAPERRAVYLRMAPSNVPLSAVIKIDDTVQFASHAVNIWVPNFGDSRVDGAANGWDLPAVTQQFYRYFADEYDTLAIVAQTQQPTEGLAFHRNVRNEIAGIGLPVFDETAEYGSTSVLQGVEVYPSGRWAEASTLLHEQAHQWNEYTQAWANVGPSIVREGNGPETHTPLLMPGAVLAGAVLEATRRVGEPAPGEATFVVERTLPTILYNPLTLYRMGLIPASELPTYHLFEDQGQFALDRNVSVGTVVAAGRVAVTADDFIAADGIRNGPVVSRVRRALVYVSRTGLASQDEMDVVNYFAARSAAPEGVTSWDRYPSFFAATQGKAELQTDITPKPVAAGQVAKIDEGPDVMYPDVAADALVGFRLDAPIPGRIGVGHTVALRGTVTLTDRTDYNIVCFRFIRYGSSDVNEVFVCGSLGGSRFSIPVTFSSEQQGTYTVEPFAFWSNSGAQFSWSRYGVIVVDAGGP